MRTAADTVDSHETLGCSRFTARPVYCSYKPQAPQLHTELQILQQAFPGVIGEARADRLDQTSNRQQRSAQPVVEALSECPLNHSLRKVSRERTF